MHRLRNTRLMMSDFRRRHPSDAADFLERFTNTNRGQMNQSLQKEVRGWKSYLMCRNPGALVIDTTQKGHYWVSVIKVIKPKFN